MNVSVIGCNGYIGKHLSMFLLEKGWDVYGYDISAESKVNGINYTSLELRKKDDVNKINLNVDFIFYFAGVTGTAKSYEEYDLYIDVNEKALLHILERMKKEKVTGRIIYPSTRLVYKGKKNIPLKEEDQKEFKTLYALNKWFGENVIKQYSDYFGINYNIFRICVPYGNMFNDIYSYGTIGFMLSNAIAKKNITIFGQGEQRRTFSHIEDICSQVYCVINKEKTVNQIYNISGENISIIEAAVKIANKYNVNVEKIDWPELEKKMESGDTIFDASKILSEIEVRQKHYFNEWVDKNE